MFTPKLNSILLPQFTDTLNIYPSPVYQVLKVNWSAFLKGILPTLQSDGWNNGTHGVYQLNNGDLYLLPQAMWPLVCYWPQCGHYGCSWSVPRGGFCHLPPTHAFPVPSHSAPPPIPPTPSIINTDGRKGRQKLP